MTVLIKQQAAINEIQDQVKRAFDQSESLQIIGGSSKTFYGNKLDLPTLKVSGLDGVIQYEPGELVIQVGAGTRLEDVKTILDNEDQMLAFEAPSFDGAATIGGMVASGISGSRRPYTGAVRDYLLGADMIDGRGQHLSFGGQVMKNVAGYDVSRLLVGSMGCLGVLTQLSFKVLPKPKSESTQAIEVSRLNALQMMMALQRKYPSVSASAYFEGCLYVRFSGMENSVTVAIKEFGGESVSNSIWSKIDNLTLFESQDDLWRLSITPDSKLFLEEAALIDWGGGQRWLVNPDFHPRSTLNRTGEAGHLTQIFRKQDRDTEAYFQPLNPSLLKLHIGLKNQFDPSGILNPNKMYEQF